ncbi:hypothetical protein WJX72_011748 [[Myrmecia] bisecta]|uniref:KOW domain-containing protein n=1 Tax=[Myrmecia] bisecta TaxID=41462 RepID=A0AAW1RA26_9CHLO
MAQSPEQQQDGSQQDTQQPDQPAGAVIAAAAKVSLSFAGKKGSVRPGAAKAAGVRDKDAKELISGFSAGLVQTSAGPSTVQAGRRVIPKIEDTFKVGVGRYKADRYLPERESDDPAKQGGDRFELAAPDTQQEQVQWGLQMPLEAKQKKYIRQGESRDAKKEMIYTDADGHQKHVKRLDDQLKERQKKGVAVGKTMRVIDGRHSGLLCEVLAVEPHVEGRSDRAIVRLQASGEAVSVRHKELGEKCESAADEGGASGSGRDRLSSKSAKRDAAAQNGSAKHAKRERDADDGPGSVQEASKPSSSKRQRSASEEEPEDVPQGPAWLMPHIMVKVVDKKLQGGRLYLKKLEIVDVHQPTVCTLYRADTNESFDHVRQSQLETVVPKAEGARVMVVAGEFKGHRAKLVKRSSQSAAAAVQLLSDFTIQKVSFDDISEYVGDAGEEE